MIMMKHPSLYEINTRVWLRRFDRNGAPARLSEIPGFYWDFLADQGMDYVWLMGVWETVDGAAPEFCFEPGLQRAYREVLPDWQPEDVIGSPYAIDDYRLSPQLGDAADLQGVKAALNERGIRLILDFIPNHFHAYSALTKERPELFMPGAESRLSREPDTFFRSDGRIFAHGKDPYFPAWRDTVQVNYFHPAAREFMRDRLLALTECCDGLRCDMAMLLLNDTLQQNWGRVAAEAGWSLPEDEFWAFAIDAIRARRPDFTLIAEAYWDREWDLQQLGFDYTYDKKLTDRLQGRAAGPVRDHLRASPDYQERSVRFLENHDEHRALTALGDERARAAATIISTIPGMRLYHDGQFEGRRLRLPVQLGREPDEPDCPCAIGRVVPLELSVAGARYPDLFKLQANGRALLRPVCRCAYTFYDQLLRVVHDEVFKRGEWRMREVQAVDAAPIDDVLCWEWTFEGEHRLVVVNYGPAPARCRIPLYELEEHTDPELRDLLNGYVARLSGEQLAREGLFLQLPPYRSHIFAY